ncbi:MAG: hypothetical protein S0880_27395 [Actinomycetota bacterium]|nr:hypothetical protein [Actinomycetota bacterium]
MDERVASSVPKGDVGSMEAGQRAYGLTAWQRLCARIRMPLVAVGVIGLIVYDPGTGWGLLPVAVFAVGLALYVRLGTPHGDAIDLAPPVRGGWVAHNSPASRVPSHATRAPPGDGPSERLDRRRPAPDLRRLRTAGQR